MLSTRLWRNFASSAKLHNKVVIIGGGAGGIGLAGRLTSIEGGLNPAQISIVDGGSLFHYKPGWTLYTADDLSRTQLSKNLRDVIPAGSHFVNHHVQSIDPDTNTVFLANGSQITYDQLVIASGIQFNWGKIKGLQEALEDPTRNVTSVYHYPTLDKMRAARQKKYDTALFTQPSTPITCAGAPQKVVYLADAHWKKKGQKTQIKFIQGAQVLFGVKFYAQRMEQVVKERGIENIRGADLIEVLEDNTAVFINNQTKETFKVPFEFLHAVPFMSGPSYLQGTKLADGDNFVTVNKNTLRHTKYSNVWGLGDSSNLPTSKTFSAVLEQSYVLSNNLVRTFRGENPLPEYDGYTCCPLLVGDGRCTLAEFKYDQVINPSFYDDQRNPTKFGYLLKKHLFPFAALNLMHRGLWQGRRTLWEPTNKDLRAFQAAEEARLSR